MQGLGRSASLPTHRGAAAALLLTLALAGCDSDEPAAQQRTAIGGDPHRGAALIEKYGCGACHQIPGIADADGLVGPPLSRIASRVYIAGMRRNTPEDMIAWLRDPQAIVPGNAMPNMGLDQRDARDVATYLYTLR
jgi:putative membrane protein